MSEELYNNFLLCKLINQESEYNLRCWNDEIFYEIRIILGILSIESAKFLYSLSPWYIHSGKQEIFAPCFHPYFSLNPRILMCRVAIIFLSITPEVHIGISNFYLDPCILNNLLCSVVIYPQHVLCVWSQLLGIW